MYIIRDREAGNIIEECETLEEAEQTIIDYEEEDKGNNSYVANFYEIYKK